MAQSDALHILVTAGINIDKSLDDINKAIETLSKHSSLKKLILKFDVDQSFVRTITSFTASTQKLSKAFEVQNQLTKEAVTEYKKLENSIEKIKEKHLAHGTAINIANNAIDESNFKINQETQAYEAQSRTLKQLELNLNNYALASQKANQNKNNDAMSYSSSTQNPGNRSSAQMGQNSSAVQNNFNVNNHIKESKADEKSITAGSVITDTLSAAIPELIPKLSGLATAEAGAATATSVLRVALSTLGRAFLPVAVVSGVTWALQKLFGAINAHNEAVKKAKEINYDQANSLKDQKQSIEQLSDEMQRLQALENSGTINLDEKKRLLDIQTQLVEKYGVSANGINTEGKAYTNSVEAIKARTDALNKQIKAEYELNRNKLLAQDNENTSDIKKKNNEIQDYVEDIQKSKNAINKIKKDIASGKITENDLVNGQSGMSYKRTIESYYESIAINEGKKNSANSELQELLSKRIGNLNNQSSIYIEDLNKQGQSISDTQRAFLQEITKSLANNGQGLESQEKSLKKVIDSFRSGGLDDLINQYQKLSGAFKLNPTNDSFEQINSLRTKIEQMVNSVVSANNISTEFTGTVMSMVPSFDLATAKANAFNETSERIKTIQSEAALTYKNSIDEIKYLNGIINQINRGEKLTGEQAAELAINYKQLAPHIKKVADGWTVEASAVRILQQAKVKEGTQTLETEKIKTKATLQATLNRLGIYGIELEALNRIDEKNKVLAELDKKKIKTPLQEPPSRFNNPSSQPYNDGAQLFAEKRNKDVEAGKQQVNNLWDLYTQLEKLEEIMSDPGTGVSESTKKKDKEKKSNDALNDSYSETNEVLTTTLKQLKDIDAAVEKLQSNRSRLREGSAEYRKSLADENILLKRKSELIKKGLKNPTELVTKEVTTTVKGKNEPSATSSTSSTSSNSTISNLISNALSLQYKEKKFKYGKVTGEFKGTYDEFVKGAVSDCSQFVQEMFKKFTGVHLPRTAAAQSKKGIAVSKNDLKPGDLVFFNTTGTSASHVGIYTGNGKFIQMGDNGLKESNINSSYWKPKYESARRIITDNNPVVTNSTKQTKSSNAKTKTSTKLPSKSDLAEAEEKYNKVLSDTSDSMYQNGIKSISDEALEAENKFKRFDNLISKSQSKQSSLDDTSQEWRDAEASQSYYYQQQINVTLNENKMLKSLVKAKKITSGEFDDKIAENELKVLDLQNKVSEKRYNIIDSQIRERNKQIELIQNGINDTTAKMGLMTEGSQDYIAAMKSQIPEFQKMQSIHRKNIALANEELKSNKLTEARKQDLIKIINSETSAWLDNEASIKANVDKMAELRENAADKIIEDYKKTIENSRDLELDALEQVRKNEDKRHEDAKKHIEDESKAFEDYINVQLKALDRQNSSDDYETELNKKLKERQKIIDQLNVLALDNSMSAKAKRKDLNEQLNVKNEEIDKFELDRNRELRKQGLQDQLDDRKKFNDKLSEAEDKLNKENLDNNDKEKEAIEQKYKDILNDEKKIYDLKKDLLSNNEVTVKNTLNYLGTEYDKYFLALQQHVFITTKSFDNFNDSFEKMKKNLSNYGNGDYSNNDKIDTGYVPPHNMPGVEPKNNTPEARVAWETYLSNKKKAEYIKELLSAADSSTKYYKDLDKQFSGLKSANDELRSRYTFFPDKSYKFLENFDPFTAETGGMTPAWGSGGKFLLAHEKELILNKTDTANLLSAIDIVRSITQPIRNFSKMITNNQNQQNVTHDQSINIDNVTIQASDKDSGLSMWSKFEAALKTKMTLGTI